MRHATLFLTVQTYIDVFMCQGLQAHVVCGLVLIWLCYKESWFQLVLLLGCIDSTGGDALEAFKRELSRLRLDEVLLRELILEYASYRGLLLPGLTDSCLSPGPSCKLPVNGLGGDAGASAGPGAPGSSSIDAVMMDRQAPSTSTSGARTSHSNSDPGGQVREGAIHPVRV